MYEMNDIVEVSPSEKSKYFRQNFSRIVLGCNIAQDNNTDTDSSFNKMVFQVGVCRPGSDFLVHSKRFGSRAINTDTFCFILECFLWLRSLSYYFPIQHTYTAYMFRAIE